MTDQYRALTDRVAAALQDTYGARIIDRGGKKRGLNQQEARHLAKTVIKSDLFGAVALGSELITAGREIDVVIDEPINMAQAAMKAVNDHRAEKMERLVAAIDAMNPHGKDEDAAKRLYDVLWAAICHQTSRAARYYGDTDTPEGRLYAEIGHAFYVYGKSE